MNVVGPEMQKHARSGLASNAMTFGIVQLILIVGGVSYGAYRVHSIEGERVLPVPNNEPVQVKPLYDRPEVVSDRQLTAALNKLKPRFRGPHPKINYVDHALRFWGVEAVFEEPDCLSGLEMRELLLDHRAFSKAWGPKTKPFLIPDTRGETLAFRTQAGQATASHVDHTIAGLGEVGTPLDYPVITPVGETTLRPALEESLRDFKLNQEEYEWSTLAFVQYLPHVKSWFTTEGQQITWDRLAERLMRQRLAQGVCFGNHRLHALVMLLRIDDQFQILSPEGRKRILGHLKDASARLVATQYPDGHWDGAWPGDERDAPAEKLTGPIGPQADRLLATGHALEWLALAPAEVQPPEATVVRAAQWLCREIDGLKTSEVNSYYPFLTHAGRALALWRGRFPHEHLAAQQTGETKAK